MREGSHEARNFFTRGQLKFETKWGAIEDMGRDRVVTEIGREVNFTVMDDIRCEASGEEELSCGWIGGVSRSSHVEELEEEIGERRRRDLPQW